MKGNMKAGQKLWTHNELMLAINIYCKLDFGQLDHRTNEVIELADLIGRTPSAVAWKLNNFASFDPSLQARGIKGATNASKLDKMVWEEFFENWDDKYLESEKSLAKVKNTTIEELNNIELPKSIGLDKERIVKTRVNQSLFRKIILATYNTTCCISGLNIPELLIASHIVPWSKDQKNRLNPMNGLCLNVLLDKAFDVGLLTISAKTYKVIISNKLKRTPVLGTHENLLRYDGTDLKLPKRFLPSSEFLKIHNNYFAEKG